MWIISIASSSATREMYSVQGAQSLMRAARSDAQQRSRVVLHPPAVVLSPNVTSVLNSREHQSFFTCLDPST